MLDRFGALAINCLRGFELCNQWRTISLSEHRWTVRLGNLDLRASPTKWASLVQINATISSNSESVSFFRGAARDFDVTSEDWSPLEVLLLSMPWGRRQQRHVSRLVVPWTALVGRRTSVRLAC